MNKDTLALLKTIYLLWGEEYNETTVAGHFKGKYFSHVLASEIDDYIEVEYNEKDSSYICKFRKKFFEEMENS